MRRARATINGDGMIVLPGLVETHWHMWNTLLRSMSGDKPEHGYFRTTAALGQKCEPGDMYQGTRLAAAEAINTGITFVHDWCHNIRGFDYAEADLRALRETGIRGALLLWRRAGHAELGGDQSRRSRAAASRMGELFSNDGLITLGLAWRGMGGNNPATAIPPEIYRREIEAARKLGLPISVHASGSRPATGQIEHDRTRPVCSRKDMQFIHATSRLPDEIAAVSGRRRLDQHLAVQRVAHRFRHAADRRTSSLPASRSGSRSTPSSSPAMPTCSGS